MYLTVKQQIKHLSKTDYKSIKELSHTAKNLANQAIYNIHQYYFKEKKYLNYKDNYNLLKSSPNYKLLNSNMAQQILKEIDGLFKSFFGLLKLAKQGKYEYKNIKLPNYLPKEGFTTLIIDFIRLNKNKLILPYSNQFNKLHKKIEITMPPILMDKQIKEIRIIPKSNARFFEIQYIYYVQQEQRKLDKNKALAIDLGTNNLATCVSSSGKSFIIDGKRLKSINQWYNKTNARLQSIKDKQKIKSTTNMQKAIAHNRNNRVNDYISKACQIIINYCLEHEIGQLIVRYNKKFQRNSNIGKQNNQNFVNIPFEKLNNKLIYLCKLYGIKLIQQEESYTSKSSFFDRDDIPIYKADDKIEHKFSGKRIKRRVYKTSKGKIVNADVNGASNILKKVM